MHESYVYSLSDPRTSEVFYVGVTNDPPRRFTAHLHNKSCNERLRAIIADLANNDLSPKMEVLEEINDSKIRYDRERHWILKHIRSGANLCNVSGLFYRGRRLSEETIFGKADFVLLNTNIRPDQLAELDAIAKQRGTNKSDVMRDLIDIAIGQLKEPAHDPN